MIIVSACLLGINCKYDGRNNYNKDVIDKVSEQGAIPVCPEQLGGCPTPRIPCEIVGGTGKDVLDGKAKVITADGRDVTDNLIKGANEVLRIAKMAGVSKAILKSKSPSCGCNKIYDGSFSGKLIDGRGVTAELLKRNGIEVMEI